MEERSFYIWMRETAGLSSKQALVLVRHFGSAEAVWRAASGEAAKAAKLGILQKRRFANKSLAVPDRILGECMKQNIHVLHLEHALYPQRLAAIYNPPLVLYVRGTLPVIDKTVSVAVVGHRRASADSLLDAEKLGYQLSSAGAILISGMAEGIDSAAHRGALKGGTPTVAVFGTAIDHCYPAFNVPLMRDIIGHGAVISETPPGGSTDRSAFPQRNRIISGLALGTVVVEAPKNSGSLITAQHALDQGRDVFAVPGGLRDSRYFGSNQLIQDGAKLIMTAEDVLKEYQGLYPLFPPKQTRPFEHIETKDSGVPLFAVYQQTAAKENQKLPDQILAVLSVRKTPDELAEICQADIGQVRGVLTMLEVEGKAHRLPGDFFEKS